MAEEKSWLDFWVFPWVAGLALALILYGLPELTRGRKTVTLFLDGPFPCLDTRTAEGSSLAVNGKSETALYAYRVGIRNSGRDPLSRVPLAVTFNVDRPEFSVLNLHSRMGSGPMKSRVSVQEPDARSRQIVYDVLQPREEDTITVRTNSSAKPRLSCRQEDVGVRFARPNPGWGGHVPSPCA